MKLKRREFIKMTAGAGAGLLFGEPLFAESPLEKAMRDESFRQEFLLSFPKLDSISKVVYDDGIKAWEFRNQYKDNPSDYGGMEHIVHNFLWKNVQGYDSWTRAHKREKIDDLIKNTKAAKALLNHISTHRMTQERLGKYRFTTEPLGSYSGGKDSVTFAYSPLFKSDFREFTYDGKMMKAYIPSSRTMILTDIKHENIHAQLEKKGMFIGTEKVNLLKSAPPVFHFLHESQAYIGSISNVIIKGYTEIIYPEFCLPLFNFSSQIVRSQTYIQERDLTEYDKHLVSHQLGEIKEKMPDVLRFEKGKTAYKEIGAML